MWWEKRRNGVERRGFTSNDNSPKIQKGNLPRLAGSRAGDKFSSLKSKEEIEMKKTWLILLALALLVGCTQVRSHEVYPIKENIYLMSFVYTSPSWSNENAITAIMDQKATEFCLGYQKVCDFYGLKQGSLKARFWGFECPTKKEK